MKRFLILLAVLGLTVGSVATADAKGKEKPVRVERTVEGTYGPYPSPITGCNSVLGKFSCLNVEARPTEAFLTAKVTDNHGQPVFVEVHSGPGNLLATFCGETTEPIWFGPGADLHFYVGLGGGLSLGCPANRAKTTGTISVTLSSQP